MSERFAGYLLVNKLDLGMVSEDRWKTALPIARDEIESRYVGLECEPWPDDTAPPELGEFPRVAPTSMLARLGRHFDSDKARAGRLRLLYVASDRSRKPRSTDGFAFAGYDYGYLVSKYKNYSVVLNEVLFGLYADLTAFSKHLNGSLLIGSLDTIRFLARTRARLLQQGADLETGDECGAIEIFVTV
jgi:hypothetical protein